MQVSLTAAAQADLDGIEAFIAVESRAAAGRLIETVLLACTTLADLPNRGRRGALTGTRELVVKGYVVTYRVRADLVEVTRIRHHAQLR